MNNEGYTPVPHELAEALMRTNLSPYESCLLWAVLRKTYGWHKRDDWISLSQLEHLTGLGRSSIVRARKRLIDKKIIAMKGKRWRPKIYSINERWWEWGNVRNSKTVDEGDDRIGCRGKTIGCTDNLELAAETPTKDTITKEDSVLSSSKKTEHAELIYHFCDKYQECYGRKYVPNSHDYTSARRLVTRLGLLDCKERIDNAFHYEYWFNRDQAITFGTCAAHVNQLVPPRRKKPATKWG